MKLTSQSSIADNLGRANPPLLVALGALGWFIGVLFIRFTGTTFFVKGGLWLVGLYLLSIPVAWLLVNGIATAGKLSGAQLLLATVIPFFTASLLDGVAITWFPSLYGLPTSAHLLAAAWLLWAVGISLGISVIATCPEIAGCTNQASQVR